MISTVACGNPLGAYPAHTFPEQVRYLERQALCPKTRRLQPRDPPRYFAEQCVRYSDLGDLEHNGPAIVHGLDANRQQRRSGISVIDHCLIEGRTAVFERTRSFPP